ncbi:MAG: ATP-binding cassette domain-containing protein [Chitinophagales bacterium]|nr:ATP-binding cassette domain-containing protein [Chitinophagales bacterium]
MEEQVIIELRDAVIYQQETLILSNVNLTIRKGEFVYLIGKTGSGKSSLLKVLYGDLMLAGGSGFVAGHDLKSITWKKLPFLRRNLGIIFQDFQLLTDRSVDANLSFVLHATGWTDKQKMQARITEVLEMVGLKTKGFKMPHELSGGEQQRVVIARALLNHPALILADEPTGNLDPDTSDEILRLLMDISLKSNTAVLIASHDFMTIQKFPSRTLKCENGKVHDMAVLETA